MSAVTALVASYVLGDNIRAHRQARSMTQAQLAAGIGVTAAAVTFYELGQRDMPVSRLLAIARELNVDARELLKGVSL